MIFGPRAFFTQMPFTCYKSGITIIAKTFCQCIFILWKIPYIISRKKLTMTFHAAPIFTRFFSNPIRNSMARSIFSRHSTCTRRTGHLTSSICISKLYATFSQSVQVRGFIVFTPHTRQIIPTIVISQNKQHIHRFF